MSKLLKAFGIGSGKVKLKWYVNLLLYLFNIIIFLLYTSLCFFIKEFLLRNNGLIYLADISKQKFVYTNSSSQQKEENMNTLVYNKKKPDWLIDYSMIAEVNKEKAICTPTKFPKVYAWNFKLSTFIY